MDPLVLPAPGAREDHDRFVRDVKSSGGVWGLRSDQGWADCESEEYEDTDVHPFWSDEASARPLHGRPIRLCA
ncbi:MAG: DUF2750 domain-containing protein [Bdellovibrio bacteriovorus]